MTGVFTLTMTSIESRAADLTRLPLTIDTLTSVTTSTTGFHGMIGAGLFNGGIIHAEDRLSLQPLLFMRYDDWAYASLQGGGVWLLQSSDKALRLGLGVSVHPAFNPFQGDSYDRWGRRGPSFDGGVNASWRTSIIDVGASYAQNIGNNKKRDTAVLRVSHGFLIGSRLMLTPDLVAQWNSSEVAYHHFGMYQNTSITDRLDYQKRRTSIAGGVLTDYRLTEAWSLLGDIQITHVDAVGNDNLFEGRKESTRGVAGFGWHF